MINPKVAQDNLVIYYKDNMFILIRKIQKKTESMVQKKTLLLKLIKLNKFQELEQLQKGNLSVLNSEISKP